MAYYKSRPVIVRTKHSTRESHYVMTAEEAGEAIVNSLTHSVDLIGIQITPVDGVSDKIRKESK